MKRGGCKPIMKAIKEMDSHLELRKLCFSGIYKRRVSGSGSVKLSLNPFAFCVVSKNSIHLQQKSAILDQTVAV